MRMIRSTCWGILATVCVVAGAGAQQLVVTVQKLDNSLGIYEAESGRSVARVETGVKPHEFAVSADGKFAYVTDYGVDGWQGDEPGGNTITIVDLAARKAVGTIDLGRYRRPHGIVRGRSGVLYVTVDQPAALLVVDVKKRRVATAMPTTGKKPHMVLVNAEERKAWTADVGSGTVTIYDLFYKRQVDQTEVGGAPQGMALTADEKRLFVATSGDVVVWMDAMTGKVRRSIGMLGGVSRLALSPDGRYVYASLQRSGEVAVLDARLALEVRRAKVGMGVEGLVVDASGQWLYVAAQDEDKIHVLAVPELVEERVIPTAKRPDPVFLLGR